MTNKNWWDSKSLWVLIGIASIVLTEKYGISMESRGMILALVGSKIGIQGWLDGKK